MNIELARHHMIQQQLRTSEILEPAIVETLYADRREDFVPAAQRALAFADIALPLKDGVSMLTPKLEVRILQSLALKPTDRVLEIGTGSGHMAALLAARAGEVWSIEIDPTLAEQARKNLTLAGVTNVHVEAGDGLASLPAGVASHAPFDAIVVTGSVSEVPATLRDQLAVGGRLIAIVGQGPVMNLQRLTRVTAESFSCEDLMETSVAPLQQPAKAKFAF